MPGILAPEQFTSVGAIVPLKTACEFGVSSTMEVALFKQGLQCLREGVGPGGLVHSQPRSVMGLLPILDRLGHSSETLTHLEQNVCRISLTTVKSVNVGEMQEYAPLYARLFEDVANIPAAAAMDDESSDRRINDPRLIFCPRTSNPTLSYVAVTWSIVEAGDQLCRDSGNCFLILRHTGKMLQTIGPAWMLSDVNDPEQFEENLCMLVGPLHTRDMG